MRKREKIYQQRLTSKDKSHEQEEQIRSQLCKRLEEILIEKEDLKEGLLDQKLEVHLRCFIPYSSLILTLRLKNHCTCCKCVLRSEGTADAVNI